MALLSESGKENRMEIQEKIEALRKEIEYHIERYYNQDDPEITDYEYDQKMNELKRLEREHPEYVTPDSRHKRSAEVQNVRRVS